MSATASQSIINTRKYKIKKDQDYVVPSKGLILSWKILNCKFVPILYINDKIIKYPRKDKNIISLKELRDYIRETYDSPFLESLENVFYINQLYGIEFYKTLSNKDLFNSIFTRDIKIQLHFGKNGPEEVEVEEEYWDRGINNEIDNKIIDL